MSKLICALVLIFCITSISAQSNFIKEGLFNGYRISKNKPNNLNGLYDNTFDYFSISTWALTKNRRTGIISLSDPIIGENIKNISIAVDIGDRDSRIIIYQNSGNVGEYRLDKRITEVYKHAGSDIFDSYVAAYEVGDDLAYLRLMVDKNSAPLYLIHYKVSLKQDTILIQMTAFTDYPLNNMTKKSLFDSFFHSVINAE